MTGQKVFTNVVWRFFERFGAEIATLVVTIVLARILSPDDYGVIAIVLAITAILQIIADFGMNSALIQKKELEKDDYATALYSSLFIGTILYVTLFFVAPLIGELYDNEILCSIIRVQGTIIFVSAINKVQQAYVSRNMMFRKFFFSTIGGTVISGAVGIWMAYNGFGVWSLVAQSLINPIVDTIILFIAIRWFPKGFFKKDSFKALFKFGWKMFVANAISTVYEKTRALLIGKQYTSSDLAYYDKGNHFPRLIVSNIDSSIDSVLFPALSKKQTDPETIKKMTKRVIKVSSFVIFPMMMGLGVCANGIVSILLTDKWLPCVFFLRVFCFTYAFYPLHSANLNAIKSIGRSDTYLVLEITKRVIGISILMITLFISVEAIAYGMIVGCLLSIFINSFPNKKFIRYGTLEQLIDVLPSFLLTLAMGVSVYCISFIGLNVWLTLIIQVLLGVAIYIVGALIFKLESFYYCIDLVKSIFIKFKGNHNAKESSL